jgi:hypothetical protein
LPSVRDDDVLMTGAGSPHIVPEAADPERIYIAGHHAGSPAA